MVVGSTEAGTFAMMTPQEPSSMYFCKHGEMGLPSHPQVSPYVLGLILVSTHLNWTPATFPEQVAQEGPSLYEKQGRASPSPLLAVFGGVLCLPKQVMK